MLDALFQPGRGFHGLASNDRVAHPVQLINTMLQKIFNSWSRLYATFVDRDQQSFQFVTQIAHGSNAGHARTTFQCMQVAFEFLHGRRGPVFGPGDKRLIRLFEQLRRFFSKNCRNLGIVCGVFNNFFDNRFR